jgi:hypothetical protein
MYQTEGEREPANALTFDLTLSKETYCLSKETCCQREPANALTFDMHMCGEHAKREHVNT